MGRFLTDAWFIGSRDLAFGLRQKETILWTFLMPIVFFYFIGTVTGGFTSNILGGSGSIAVRAPEGAGFLADEVERRLEEQGFELVHPDERSEAPAGSPAQGQPVFEDFTRRLELPADLTAAVLAGERRELIFRRAGGGQAADYDRFKLTRAVYGVLADLPAASGAAVGQGRPLAELGPEELAAMHRRPRALTVAVTRAGHLQDVPTGFQQAVPGTMVMFTMLVLLTSGAVSLLTERRQGLLRRLASAPVARGVIVLGKWGGNLVLGFVQIGFALAVGSLFFGVDWGPSLPTLLAVLASYAALMASLALLLGNFARTEGQVIGLAVLTSNVFGALGGCWWPIEVTTPFMQKLALFLPTGWAMDALHALVSFGAEPSRVLPHLLGMTLGALLLGRLCARFFRFG